MAGDRAATRIQAVAGRSSRRVISRPPSVVGGGEGFRTFTYRSEGEPWIVAPLRVHDLSAIQPFEGAANRTAVFLCSKGYEVFKYPIPYVVWRKGKAGKVAQHLSLDEVKSQITRVEISAEPIQRKDITSPWLTAPRNTHKGIRKILGQSEYKARLGCHTWMNGVYWINVLEVRRNGELVIENLPDMGKTKVPHVREVVIEPDLVYPLLRGRDVQRWNAEPSVSIILPNRTDKLAGIPEPEMKRRWPKTHDYLKRFERELRDRAGYKKFFNSTDPFYSIYNVGPYTITGWKVVWREQSSWFQAAFAGLKSQQVIVPDHKLMLVACRSEQEAHFILGMLNSSPSILV